MQESLPDALRRIEGLSFDDKGRYKLDATGVRYSVYPDSVAYPLRLRFGKIRRDTLPQIERAGKLNTLELDEDAGIIDLSHVVIFEDGFVAAEWNPDGPKLATLGNYIFEKGKINSPPRFLNLLERDIVEVLSSLASVRVLEIDLPPDAVALAREADENLAAAIEATAALGATKKTAFTLTADKPAHPLRDLAVRLATLVKGRPQDRALLNGLSVKGYSEGSRRARYIDVLESKLMTAEIFPKNSSRSRSLKSKDAYQILEAVYEQNIDRLRIAASSSDFI
ncbi:hypothetical protein [Novosphingobium mangrovi (ex Huang et al. 2023)]|uniref:Uncharacterized protein n=1 Tax=Novosphingobium mangrovi (ex Huang et al. 2023) TaxID=2976432 RepID=A0ABT2I4T6_9SPHN|nr:hypothetical protein [Novosphingobium mangrovi (ex Huang et al. 2023)]MCT2399840.1 hypothetical protein [Novosphingobium mangrovi (ex Huang et al. 2023)]